MNAGEASVDQFVEAQRSSIDEQSPWPGLGAFDEAAQRFFNGRRNETAELRRLVLSAPLTVVFGGSGLGKTSLLQAGLFPLLRKENVLPIYVRLDVRDRGAPLIDQVTQAMLEQFLVLRAGAPPVHAGESLWEWLHRDVLEVWSQRNQLLTPLFVFDQFEEVFTLGAENSEAIARFRIDLADLVENRIPAVVAGRIRASDGADADLSVGSQRYKVLVSFREDFLPAVEGWKRDLPSIMRNRLRLLPMSGEQAFEAVHLTAPHLADEATAWNIVRFVAAAQEEGTSGAPGDAGSDKDLAVEPSLLSLVCHGLNQRRKAQGKASFDLALLQGTGQAIISDYYQQSVGDLPERVQRFIEGELITERGFRKPCDIDDARTVHFMRDQELRLLVDRRLFRIEPHQGTEWVELTHDLLTRVIREHRDRQRETVRQQESEKARIRQRRLIAIGWMAASVVALIALMLFGMYSNAKAEVAKLDEERHRLADQTAKLESQSAALRQAMGDAGAQLTELIRSTTAIEDLVESKQTFLRSLDEARFLIDLRMRFDSVHAALERLGDIAPELKTARPARAWVTVLASAPSSSLLEVTDAMRPCMTPEDRTAVRRTPNGLFALVLLGDGTFTTAYRRTVQFRSMGCVTGAYFADTVGW